MKKRLFLLPIVSALTLAPLTGCQKSYSEYKLVVRYYPGGYGIDWMEDYIKEYLAEKNGGNPNDYVVGKDFKLIPDADINYGASKYLKSKKECPDLILSNFLEPENVQAGLVADLNSVYNTEVNTSYGKVKIKDYIDENILNKFSYQQRYGQGEEYAWGMPWSTIPCAMSYNETLLKQINHVSSIEVKDDAIVDGKWNRPPETVTELSAYFEDIDNYNQVNNRNIIKLSWAAKDGSQWLEFMLHVWWAQYQGVFTSRVPGENAYYDFYNCRSEEEFKQSGLQYALGVLKNLITTNEGADGKFINGPTDPLSDTIKDSQTAFARGNAAMCLTGDFFEKEYKTWLDESKQVIKMMRVPSIDNAEKNEHGEDIKLVKLQTEAVMYVPQNAIHRAEAKELLAFMCNEDKLMDFTKKTGGIRPFDYNPIELEPDYAWTDFQKSVFDIYYNSDEKLMIYPKNEAAAGKTLSPVYYYHYSSVVTPFMSHNSLTILSKLRKLTPKQIMVDGVEGSFDSVYKLAKRQYDDWRRIYDLNAE